MEEHGLLPGPRQIPDAWFGADRPSFAFAVRDRQLDRRGLAQKVQRIEAQLRGQGVKSGALVVLGFPNSAEFVAWMFAVFRTGASVVPINPRSATPELHGILERSGAGFVAAAAATWGNTLEEWGWAPAFTDAGSAVLWRTDSRREESATISKSFGLIHQFTSGSTGSPRCLVREEEQIREDYSHFVRRLQIDSHDRLLLAPPFYHAFGMLGLFAGLASGATVHALDRFLPAEFLRVAKAFRPTVVFSTPAMVDMLGRCFLSADDAFAFQTVRHFICSTDRLKKSVHDVFVARFGTPVRVQYGSTETLSATIDLADDFVEGRVGQPYPGVDVRIFGEDRNALKTGITGRVGIKSPAAVAKYADDFLPALQTIDGYVIPGDRGFIDDAGDLHLIGREGILNIGGWKVDPAEITAVIEAAFNVSYIAVLPFERVGQPAIKVVLESTDPAIQPERVISHCRASLSDYKVPARVEIYNALPRDANGKVRLAELHADKN